MMIIETKKICKNYGANTAKVEALKNINLAVEEGEFVAIYGPSGCGKSTLLHILGAMDKPTSGVVNIANKSLQNMNEKELAKFRLEYIGFIFQTFNLISSLTALENVMLPIILKGVSKKDARLKALELLKEVDLKERANNIPSKMSGGQRQRVAIARALANDPVIILADEPTGNLDSENSKKIIDLLCELNKKGHTILMVTHNNEIASRVSRIINIKDGQII